MAIAVVSYNQYLRCMLRQASRSLPSRWGVNSDEVGVPSIELLEAGGLRPVSVEDLGLYLEKLSSSFSVQRVTANETQ